jgi:chloramphenicol-sensitive protein RarD
MNAGILYAGAAYLLWGLFPVYFKALAQVPATEILAHRMVWSLLFCAALLLVLRRWTWLRTVATQPRVLAAFVLSAAVVSINWGVYIWAVNADRVVDASLGYFINPLVNVLFGALLLAERLHRDQWAAVGIAAAGVAWLTWQAAGVPWIGLVLAVSFATYGLLRKRAALGSIEGLTLETLLLFPLALGYLVWLAQADRNTFLVAGAATQGLLAAAGPVTALPLLLFAAGARRIAFSTLGILQYIAPTLQLLVGVWVYGEPFEPAKAAGYGLIWTALAVFTAGGLWRMRRAHAANPCASGANPSR